MKFITVLPLFLFLSLSFQIKAQHFSVNDLVEIRAMDISDASTYFEKKKWKLYQTRKNPDTSTEIFWTKGEAPITMFRYILTHDPANSAVSVMFGDKSNFESMKKEVKKLGMQQTGSGVDEQGQIYSIYTSPDYQLRFSTSSDKKMTYYQVFLIVNPSKS